MTFDAVFSRVIRPPFGPGLSSATAAVTLEAYITSLSPTWWYQADIGDIISLADGAAVGAWDDQSTNTLDLAQGTASAKPTYQTNELNTTLPVVRFDGGDNLARANVAGSLFSANQGSTIVVAKSTGAAVCGFGEWKTTSTNLIEFLNTSDVLSYDHGNVTVDQGRIRAAQPAGWDNNYHVHECHRQTDGSGSIVIDGTALTLIAAADTFTDDLDVSSAGTIRVGTTTASGAMTGDMYLYLHFKIALTSGQLGTLRQLIEDRTGIPCSPFDLGITIPSDYQIFQRDVTTGDITIAGTVDA